MQYLYRFCTRRDEKVLEQLRSFEIEMRHRFKGKRVLFGFVYSPGPVLLQSTVHTAYSVSGGTTIKLTL